MMLASAWVFFAFCFVSVVQGSEADNAACDRAKAERQESSRKVMEAIDSIVSMSSPIFMDSNNTDLTSNASVEAGTFCPGPKLRQAAESSENLIRQCLPTSDVCREDRSIYDFAPDVLRAAGEFCDNAQASEYVNHARTLARCWGRLSRRREEALAARNAIEPPVYQLAEAELAAARDNSTVSCGLVNGRKYACRMIQIGVPFCIAVSNEDIMEICWKKALDLVVMLQERALNALRCFEFGDYVKDFGVFKVTYLASVPAPVPQQ